MIQLLNVNKTYPSRDGDVVALKGVNLTIPDREIYGIIGLSGAGKSTLVRCINLLEKPTSGKVLIDGEDLTQVKPKRLREIRKQIGMIFQHFNLLEQRTVLDNVRFPLELTHTPRPEQKRRAEELLDLVGLSDKAGAYPSQLSGGQQQRVAIARALATEPKYLLCDEATSALDPNTTQSILQLLQKINRELGVTVVVITHELKVVESICTSVAVLDHSTVVEAGDMRTVFASPRSDIAKQLILPHLEPSALPRLRLVFDGASTDVPVISGLAKDTGVAVNILFADTKTIEGNTFGHMVIELPQDEADQAAVKTYLDDKGVRYEEDAV